MLLDAFSPSGVETQGDEFQTLWHSVGMQWTVEGMIEAPAAGPSALRLGPRGVFIRMYVPADSELALGADFVPGPETPAGAPVLLRVRSGSRTVESTISGEAHRDFVLPLRRGVNRIEIDATGSAGPGPKPRFLTSLANLQIKLQNGTPQ